MEGRIGCTKRTPFCYHSLSLDGGLASGFVKQEIVAILAEAKSLI